jgi:hypothetical protein
MTMIKLTILAVVSACVIAGSAQEAQRSAPILKSELLGYWKIERHAWLLLSDGRMLSCPTTGPDASTLETEHWDVRNGIFYWLVPGAGSNLSPYKIIAHNKRELIIQSLAGDETDTFYRLSRDQAEGF